MEVRVDGLVDAAASLSPNIYRKAMTRALNEIGQQAFTQIKQQISDTFTIPKREITKAIKVKKANYSTLTIMLIASGQIGLPIILFNTKYGKGKKNMGKNVRTQVKRASAFHYWSTAFVNTMNSGHVGVYRRTGARRLPIEQIYSVSPVQLMDNEKTNNVVNKTIQDKFDIIFKRNYEYLSSLSGGA